MGQNADEFPQSAMLGDNAVRVEMDAQVLLGGINRAVFATADDELRPVMNGIYFDITTEDITMVASDGHKLVRCKTLAAKEAGFADEESAAERTRHGDYRVRRTQRCVHIGKLPHGVPSHRRTLSQLQLCDSAEQPL